MYDLVAALAFAVTVGAAECPWDDSFVSATAKPLPVSDLKGIGKRMPVRAIVERLGPAAREVGSGLHVLQWDVADGRIFFVSTDSACGMPLGVGFQTAHTPAP